MPRCRSSSPGLGREYILPDGSTSIAAEQVEPTLEPEYRGDPAETSLIYESDMIAAKPGTDILVNGDAISVDGKPCRSMLVGLQTPTGSKSLRVTGDRAWERTPLATIEPGPITPFVTMPICYERAHGAFDRQDPDPAAHRLDPANPVGTGFFTSGSHRVGKPVPNIESTDGTNPAGFGPLGSHWKPRIDHQGTYDAAWLEKRKPLLPKDYDSRFLQCAPVDQQITPHLRGGEHFGVVGMSPGGGALRFKLPKHYLAFQTKTEKNRHEHRAKINTVIIEPNVNRVMLVWHTQLACHHEIDDIVATRITEREYVDL